MTRFKRLLEMICSSSKFRQVWSQHVKLGRHFTKRPRFLIRESLKVYLRMLLWYAQLRQGQHFSKMRLGCLPGSTSFFRLLSPNILRVYNCNVMQSSFSNPHPLLGKALAKSAPLSTVLARLVCSDIDPWAKMIFRPASRASHCTH